MTRTERLILTIAILAAFVAFLDGSVINVALPSITEELGGGLPVQQWVVDAFLITLGALILLAGSLSDAFGRWLILKIGLIGFGVASLLIAVAPTAELLIVFRALQGVAGALLVPSSLAIILANFRDVKQAKAIGLWTAWTSAAFLLGPLLGGFFVDFLTWRLVFAINVLPIAVTLWLIVVLKQADERSGVKIDWIGAVLSVIGLGGPVFALIEQANLGWDSPAIYLPLVIGLVALAAFVWRQKRIAKPMLPLELFSVRNFSMGNLATFVIYAALSMVPFLITLFLLQVADYPATLAALALLPITIAVIAFSSFFGGLSAKIGPRVFMTFGPVTMGIGVLLMLGITDGFNYWTMLFPGVILFSLGLSATVAPLTSAILGSIDSQWSGIGSAINNAVARIAGLIAIASVGLIVGTTLDADSLRRALIIGAALLVVGGVISWLGIRNPQPAPEDVPQVPVA